MKRLSLAIAVFCLASLSASSLRGVMTGFVNVVFVCLCPGQCPTRMSRYRGPESEVCSAVCLLLAVDTVSLIMGLFCLEYKKKRI